MSLQGKRIGIAFTGSFCTYEKVFEELRKLAEEGAWIQTVFSNAASTINSQFGNAGDFVKMGEKITGNRPVMTIAEAEPIGPGSLFDILVLFPCTGNTIAKLANGITDTPVLMAAKAHLRNNKPHCLEMLGAFPSCGNGGFVIFCNGIAHACPYVFFGRMTHYVCINKCVNGRLKKKVWFNECSVRTIHY